MEEEIKRKVGEELSHARRHLRAAQRIATTSPNVSKHLIRSLRRMADDCDYERRRVME